MNWHRMSERQKFNRVTVVLKYSSALAYLTTVPALFSDSFRELLEGKFPRLTILQIIVIGGLLGLLGEVFKWIGCRFDKIEKQLRIQETSEE